MKKVFLNLYLFKRNMAMLERLPQLPVEEKDVVLKKIKQRIFESYINNFNCCGKGCNSCLFSGNFNPTGVCCNKDCCYCPYRDFNK